MGLHTHNLKRVLIALALICVSGFGEGQQQGGQGGGGSSIAALAGILAPITAAVTASIQASAQSQVQGINATTAVQMTAINANLAAYQAQLAQQTSLFQTTVAMQINADKNALQQDLLLGTLRHNERKEELAFKRAQDKAQIDLSYQRALIGLEYSKMEANRLLAQATLQAQLSAGGLQSPLVRVDGPNSGLTVTPAGGQGVLAASTNPGLYQNASVGPALAGVYNASLSSGSTRAFRRSTPDLALFQTTVHRGYRGIAGEGKLHQIQPEGTVQRHRQ